MEFIWRTVWKRELDWACVVQDSLVSDFCCGCVAAVKGLLALYWEIQKYSSKIDALPWNAIKEEHLGWIITVCSFLQQECGCMHSVLIIQLREKVTGVRIHVEATSVYKCEGEVSFCLQRCLELHSTCRHRSRHLGMALRGGSRICAPLSGKGRSKVKIVLVICDTPLCP